MNFTPKSKNELRESMMLPDGEYDFEVEKAEDGVSKKDNEMVALTLKVWDANGKVQFVRDWLMDINERAQLKMLNFCETTGTMEAYNAGRVDAIVCQGLVGRVLIGHQNSDDYGPQNRVIDYCPSVDQISQDRALGVPMAQQRAARKAAEERAAESGGTDAEGRPLDIECPF